MSNLSSFYCCSLSFHCISFLLIFNTVPVWYRDKVLSSPLSNSVNLKMAGEEVEKCKFEAVETICWSGG